MVKPFVSDFVCNEWCLRLVECQTPHTLHLAPTISHSHTLHLALYILHLTFCTIHLAPTISHLASCTLHLAPDISHLTSHTLHITLYILHRTSWTLHLELYISHFTSCTWHFTPYILHLTSLTVQLFYNYHSETRELINCRAQPQLSACLEWWRGSELFSTRNTRQDRW